MYATKEEVEDIIRKLKEHIDWQFKFQKWEIMALKGEINKKENE